MHKCPEIRCSEEMKSHAWNAEHKSTERGVAVGAGPGSHGTGLFSFQRQWGTIQRNAVGRPCRVPIGFRNLEVTGDPVNPAREAVVGLGGSPWNWALLPVVLRSHLGLCEPTF